MIQCGLKAVLGIRDLRPIVGAPEGKQRIRMRVNDFARLYVRTADGLRAFILTDNGDTWGVREIASVRRIGRRSSEIRLK